MPDAPKAEDLFNIRRILMWLWSSSLGRWMPIGRISGLTVANIYPYDPVSNPDGWHPNDAASAGFVNAVMEENARQNARIEAAILEQNRIAHNSNLLLQAIMDGDVLEAIPPDALGGSSI